MTLEIRLILIAVLAVGLLAGFNRFIASERAAGAAECRAAQAKVDAAAADRHEKAAQEITRESAKMEAKRVDDAQSLAVAGSRLRDRYAAAIQPSSNPASAAVGAPAPAAPVLSTDMFGAAEERLRFLAAEADRSRDEGTDCERRYDSLKE
jgi:hypothetical protein